MPLLEVVELDVLDVLEVLDVLKVVEDVDSLMKRINCARHMRCLLYSGCWSTRGCF